MSKLTYLDELLNCVDTECKVLGEICEVGDGNHSSKYPRSDEMVDQGVPFIRGTNMVNGTVSAQDMKFITQEKHQELKKGHLKAYDVLITNRGEVGKIAQVPKQFSDSNLNSQLAWLRANQGIILPRYLFYVLNTSHVQSNISGEGGALQQLTIKNIKLIKIPIPYPNNPKKSLAIQAEIVRILDTFIELIAELTAELVARKQQYDYYSKRLFIFNESQIELRLLGDVTVYEQPTKYRVDSKDYNDDFLTPVLTAGKTFILGYTNEVEGIYEASKTPVIIFDDFTTANKWVDFDFKVKSSAMKMVTSANESEVMQKYIYYWLNTLPNELVSGDHKRQWISNFANKQIPIPPLTEQKRIVAILDKFDTLTTSLTEGLPREIALRQQQYKYYRELLLSFPKAEVADHD